MTDTAANAQPSASARTPTTTRTYVIDTSVLLSDPGMSGATPRGTGVLVGAGALGGAMLDLWTRSGWGEWTVIDEDHIKPHNLVRHPDMPAEAFADMWKTLKDGLSWRALVKNRRKNGDHYWVRANATPMKEGDLLKIADFGLAKKNAASRQLPQHRSFLGTRDYAAPEQIRGDDVDGRADIYALGCVLYEALAGTPPYESDSEASLMYAHLEKPPPRLADTRPDYAAIDGVMNDRTINVSNSRPIPIVDPT